MKNAFAIDFENRHQLDKRGSSFLLFLCVAVLFGAYGPDVGHGFVRDDFGWIDQSHVESLRDALSLFARHNGFYRPVVSLTFAITEWLFGLEPLAYGLTNLLLLVASMAALASLARALGMGSGFSWLAASLWGLNPHGVNMAVLWISGRTSLLLTLFSLMAAKAFVSRSRLAAASFCLLALFSKEEALLLPLVLAAWACCRNGPEEGALGNLRVAFRDSWLLFLTGGVYLVARSQTGAYLPWTAPPFYRFTAEPANLVRNLVEYADRACTFAAASVLLASLVLGAAPRPSPVEKRHVKLGLLWLAGGHGMTAFLPVRSSLYACFPSVGAALAGAALLASSWERASCRSRRALVTVASVVLLIMLPVYRARNARWVTPASLSTQVLADLGDVARRTPEATLILLQDEPGARTNLVGAFGTFAQDALRLTAGSTGAQVWIEPPPSHWKMAGLRPPERSLVLRYELRNGRLVPAAQ